MTTELLIMEDIVNMMESNISFKDLDENAISKLIRRIPESTDIKEIDIRMKKVLDSLAKKYGLLEALIQLQNLRWELINLIYKNRNNIRLHVDMKLIKDVIEDMIDMVSKAYSSNIYLNIFYAFLKIQKGRDIDTIMESFFDEKVPTAIVLSLSDDETKQMDMFNDSTSHDQLLPLANYISLRDKVCDNCISVIRGNFSTGEIGEYLKLIIFAIKDRKPSIYDAISPILQTFRTSIFKKQNESKAIAQNPDQIKLI